MRFIYGDCGQLLDCADYPKLDVEPLKTARRKASFERELDRAIVLGEAPPELRSSDANMNRYADVLADVADDPRPEVIFRARKLFDDYERLDAELAAKDPCCVRGSQVIDGTSYIMHSDDCPFYGVPCCTGKHVTDAIDSEECLSVYVHAPDCPNVD